jgi:pimeloyl-ACP methyl ester carboxylesterase
MQKFDKKRIEVNGINISYIDEGSSGDALMLIHGLGCSALEWSENIRPLGSNIRVIAVDLVGFGDSDRSEQFEYTPSGQAAILKKFVEKLGVARLHLAGNSYGGLVAIEFARCYPEHACSLILVNSAGGDFSPPLPMRMASLPFVGEVLTRPTWESCKQGFQVAMHDPSKLDDARVDANFAYWSIKGTKQSFLRTVRGFVGLTGFSKTCLNNVSDFLKQTSLRTLIVWGRNDKLIPFECAQSFHALIANSQLDVFEDAGHAPMVEDPVKFNHAVTTFVLSMP